MKSISIAFNAPSLSIPLGYHHQVQGLIFSLLSSGGGQALHDKSLDFGTRQYKLFTFSSLRGGKVSGDRKSLYFENTAFLDVRSVREEFSDSLIMGLKADNPIHLFGQPLTVRSFKTNETQIFESKLCIKMLSPLTVHRTDEYGRTDYLNPLDAGFSDEINNNFFRKHYAFYGEEPSGGLSIKARSVGLQDKYLTLYKKAESPNEKHIYITGWRGEYELCGRPEHLNFLYYCGIGARNSDGFGMFEQT
jgi:CRISPR-associated endoribonuclease Cas6